MSDFRPLLRNPHLATLVGNFWPRGLIEHGRAAEMRLYQTAPGTQVLVHENSPAGSVQGEVLLLHGLEGSSESGYMLSMARSLLQAGFRVHRVNMRGCGGTEHLTETLYHAGLTHDVRWLLEQLHTQGRRPRFLVGFSLGANMALKLAGELGATELLDGVVGVSTPLDLQECVRAMARRENILYEWRFITRLRSRYKLRHRARPDRFPAAGLKGAWTVYDFDDRITAQHFGFGSAANYYATQSCLNFLAEIRTPTLLVQAKDDPLIPFRLFETPAVRGNPSISLLATERGGHLGFIARGRPRFWLDTVVTGWLEAERNKARSNPVTI